MKSLKNVRAAVVGLLAAMLLAAAGSAYAIEPVDFDRKGSITLTVTDRQGSPVSGIDVRLYQVASLEHLSTGAQELVLTPDFAEGDFDLEAGTGADGGAALAKEIRHYVILKDLPGEIKSSDAEGTVTWEDLDLGVYFLMAAVTTEEYGQLSAFCVTLPQPDGDAYVYDVTAKPKSVELEEFPTTEPPVEPPDIPQTGQVWWPLPLLAVAGVALILLGLRIRRKAR